MGGFTPMSPRISSPAHPSSAAGATPGLTAAGRGRGRGFDKRDLEIIGRTVRVTQGPYKGELYSWTLMCSIKEFNYLF